MRYSCNSCGWIYSVSLHRVTVRTKKPCTTHAVQGFPYTNYLQNSSATATICSAQSIFIGHESDDAIGLTSEDRAQLLHCEQGDGFVVLEIVDGPGIDAVLVDEGIGGDPLFGHGFPQRLITDHTHRPALTRPLHSASAIHGSHHPEQGDSDRQCG